MKKRFAYILMMLMLITQGAQAQLYFESGGIYYNASLEIGSFIDWRPGGKNFYYAHIRRTDICAPPAPYKYEGVIKLHRTTDFPGADFEYEGEQVHMDPISSLEVNGCDKGAFENSPNLIKVIGIDIGFDGVSFKGCISLQTLENIGLWRVWAHQFDGCSSLTDIDLSKTEHIEEYAFVGCSSLKDIKFHSPEFNCLDIEKYAFSGCCSLETISFDKTPIFYDGVFSDCNRIKKVISGDMYPVYFDDDNVFTQTVYKNALLVVPKGTVETYKATKGWKNFYNIVEEGSEPSIDPTPSPGPDPSTDAQPYAVYNDYTLTFYCDDQRSSRTGVTYSLNEGENEPEWVLDDNNRNVEKVVFDASFSKARPTSTFQWFFYCDFLTEIKGIENLKTSEVTNMRAMFFSCNRLKSIDVSHFDTKAVEDMGGMFSNCTNLESINVSHFNTSNVYNMASMFNECQSLTDLDLSNFNTSKAEYLPYMFSGCSNLRTLYLGRGLKSSNDVSCEEAFADCPSLSKVVFTDDIPASINSKFFEGVGTAVAPATLVVQEQYKANYQAKFDGNMFYGGYFTILADNASALEDGDIFTAKTVEGVEMTFKVISAKDKTVQVGTGEENTSAVDKDYAGTLTIPKEINGYKVDEIASHAFSYCNFSEIVLPSGLTYIDTEAFYLCESLKSIRIPSSLQNMSVVAFVSCTSVESIVVEDGNEYFDSREGCNAIIRKDDKTLIRGCKNSFIPSGVERINFAAFQQTPLVGSFVIPEGVTYIGQSAFVSATMSSISLPSTLTYIGGLSFQNCNGIESVAIPEGVTYIGNYAFSFCDKLNRVTIPASVTEIGEKAFIGSTQLKTIVSYLTEPCAIADNVFMVNDLDDGNNSLINATLYVPFGSKTIYENTDGWKNFKNIVELNATVGDVTGDGEVTKEDITEVETEILEPSAVFDPNKDVNRDGVVNVADIVEGNNIRNSQ